ncbi:hypothetical protein MKSMC1_13000 [Mycobacterium kansasii]|uniref:Uncharacterized protein n=1 Tax=Mycobacterium kansasii TaxID=1768 RepID=A0A1V3XYP3_MYCKA|nr:hypothetical protein MKSMC1_13000 [Mycobacterium kansasii]OOK84325.1 hypothetical protein BZL29_0396 [Mycobacterium kansasii]
MAVVGLRDPGVHPDDVKGTAGPAPVRPADCDRSDGDYAD